MKVVDEFIKNREKLSNVIAFILKNEEKINYEKLYKNVGYVMKILREKKVKKGDKILIFINPSYELYVGIIATILTGCTLIFIDFWSNKDRINTIIKNSDAEYVFMNKKTKLIGGLNKEIRQIKNKIILDKENFKEENISNIEINDLEDGIIVYTTGSTGEPKKVVRKLKHLDNQFNLLKENNIINKKDTIMAGLPMHTLAMILLGYTIVIPNDIKWPFKRKMVDKNLKKLEKFKVTGILHSESFFKDIVKYRKEELKDKVDNIYTGGSFCKKRDLEEFKKTFKGKINLIYGCTEIFLFSIISDEEYIKRYDETSGIPLGEKILGIEYGVLKDKEIKDRGFGELVVSGNCVTITKPFKEVEKVWHRTGDIVEIKDNFIFGYGREKFKIQGKERMYYPLEIEKSIYKISKSIEGVAVLEIDKKRYVYLESKDKEDIHLVIKELKRLNIEVENCKIEELPRDRRHKSRIDLEKLYKRVTLNKT